MAGHAERPRIQIETAAGLEDWLRKNHERGESVWLVTWKKSSGGPYVSRREVVEVLLAFGWIDSLPRKLDEERTMLLISRRRVGSSWSKVNRDIAEELIRRARMKEPGQAAVDRAKRDGSWDRLDEVEDLIIPDDLAKALGRKHGARELFERFPSSSRRGILEWIQSAKRPDTRARRVADTADKAAKNLKANHPKGRDRGPAREPVKRGAKKQ